MADSVGPIDPLQLTLDSTNEEIGASLRAHLVAIQRHIASERERWKMVDVLHGEEHAYQD